MLKRGGVNEQKVVMSPVSFIKIKEGQIYAVKLGEISFLGCSDIGGGSIWLFEKQSGTT
jgi:hypothetical protein